MDDELERKHVNQRGFEFEYFVTHLKVQYYTRTDPFISGNPPKYFRTMINRSRRAKDHRELWKEVNMEDYIGEYSFWSGKDNDSGGYF